MSPPLENNINDWMHLLMRHSIKNYMRFAKSQNYSIEQLNTLIRLYHKGDCGVSDMVEESGVSNAAVSQLLEKLVQQGLILRKEDPLDRRQKVIMITEKGQKIAQEGMAARQRWFTLVISELTSEEQEEVNAAFQLLIDKAALLEER